MRELKESLTADDDERDAYDDDEPERGEELANPARSASYQNEPVSSTPSASSSSIVFE